MPLSAHEQQHIQEKIETASPQEREEMRIHAEATLAAINIQMEQTFLSVTDKHTGEIAIEVLARSDATRLGKGWLYRTKRRFQLMQMYLGN